MLDDLLPSEGWSSEQVAALGGWAQGCLVPGSIFAAAMRIEAPGGGSALEVRSTDFDPNGWMIVVSQTCDVVVTGPGARQPVVLCSPVINIGDEETNKLDKVKAWSVTDLAPLDCVPDSGVWAADLRVVIALHKDALVGLSPIAAHSDDEGAFQFGNHVATRFRRPALHDALSLELRNLLDEAIRTGPKDDDSWFLDVEQVRLEITPSRLRPTWVRIHFLCDRQLTPAERAQWKVSGKKIKKLFAEHGITYGTMAFDLLADVKATAYRQWSPLPISGLRRPQFW